MAKPYYSCWGFITCSVSTPREGTFTVILSAQSNYNHNHNQHTLAIHAYAMINAKTNIVILQPSPIHFIMLNNTHKFALSCTVAMAALVPEYPRNVLGHVSVHVI